MHSHICCTHSLSLSLSNYTHAHTTLHTHTLTPSKSGRYELNRFLEVEEIVLFFFRAELKMSLVVAFLMCSGSEFQTEGPK